MPSWLPIVASMLGGGACGAVLKVVYDHWRERRQPIVYHVTTDTIFTSGPHAGVLQANAQINYEGNTYQFDSLSLVRIEIKNKGNRDIDTFTFGLTLESENAAVRCVCDGDDRHHQISEVGPVATPAQPRSAVDFRCEPFNRADRYTIRLFVRNIGDVRPDQVKLSTATPVRFSRVQPTDDLNLVITPSRLMLLSAFTTFVVAGFLTSAFSWSTSSSQKRLDEILKREVQLAAPDLKSDTDAADKTSAVKANNGENKKAATPK